MNTAFAIQAILFATGESRTFASLAKELSTDIQSIASAVQELQASLQGHGVELITLDDTVSLATSPAYSDLIQSIRKEELSKELSKASAETLAIVAYSPGISKSQIEFVRGVNASYSLRALQMRGLIEQKGVGRGTGYWPTTAILEHFGVTRIEDLPEYTTSAQTIQSLLNTQISE
jgi:segregation and condensation protein B